MFIEKKNNKITFKYLDKAYAHIHIDEKKSEIFIDVIRVLQPFRNNGIATMILKEILTYVTFFLQSIKKISLSPLPLDTTGLNLEELINFYKKFGFSLCSSKDISTPYLMSKNI